MWEPLIKSTSEFGVTIDTIDQTTDAIEGSGTLTLFNDYDFWPANYDKLSFDNQRCILYSYHRDLDVDQAKYIFKGKVDSQTYSSNTVQFKLKDQFAELRAPIPLSDIEDLDDRTGDDMAQAKQRMVLGRVFGHVPTNLDRVLDGYPLTGTASIAFGDTTLAGTGTEFLTELSPDDEIVLLGTSYTVASVTSDTSLELTEEFTGDEDLTDDDIFVLPNEPKRYANRRFLVAGHSIREPVTTTEGGSSIDTLFVNSTRDMYDGDYIYIGELGSGELAIIRSVSGEHFIKLTTSLASPPPVGTTVRRPGVQNVRINDTQLIYYRDYTFDADTAVLTLRDTAEVVPSPVKQIAVTADFTNGSRTVTGSNFKKTIFPNYMVGRLGVAEYLEVLSVDSDTQLTLREPSASDTNGTLLYKSLVYDEDNTVLTLDCLGRTDDGTTDGTLLKTAPAMTRALLIDAGLEDELDSDSFDDAEEIAYQELGLVFPTEFDSSSQITYRDAINRINKSVIGSVIQDEDFKFSYQILEPRKPVTAAKFDESDIIDFSLNASAENIVKTVTIEYLPKEYDYVTAKTGVSTSQKTSDAATYLIKTDRERVISTCLSNSEDAAIMAARWSFLLRSTASRLSFKTKLQGALLEIGDIVEIQHRKFFERNGSTDKRKLLMVESVKRNGSDVSIEATDLSNTFSRVACINDFTNDWSDATDDELLYGGYYTDDYGLIDNDSDSSDTNLIW
jgi:hypothetical protein